jgi:rSAM-associated Gly-rich repeat protein
MTRPIQILKALSLILPAGALGASVALAAASTQAAPPEGAASGSSGDIAGRLGAIRVGVSALAASGSAEIGAPADAQAVPTWWGNGGWGRWHAGWGNGGWGNGGWHNWHNGWGNGWHNGGWGNGGWGNGGWHNFWHNW